MPSVLAPPEVTDDELQRVLNELNARKRSGDNVINPGENIGLPTSKAMSKSGYEVLLEEGQNKSYFMGWNDPSIGMHPERKNRMLSKSLKEAGYDFACPWGTLGEFLQDGWRSKTTNRGHEFASRHGETYKGIRDNGFLKARGMNTQSGEDGGFLINPEIAPTIETLFVQNDLASRVHTIPTNSTLYRWPRCKDLDRNDGTRHGGVMHAWLDEADPGAESRPKLAFTELRMKKLAVFVFMTSELMNDSPYAVEQFVKNAVREELNFALSRAIMWGAGGAEPIGIANSAAVITQAAEGGQTAGTFITANALNMAGRMWRNSAGSAIWLHHQSVLPQIGALDIKNFPVTVNLQNGGLAGPITSSLLNRPLVESELCSTLGSVGDVWYLDPTGYKAITQSMVREDISMHVEFMTDQQCLRFILRFDGAPLLPTPITPFKAPGSATPPTQSCFVRLAAR